MISPIAIALAVAFWGPPLQQACPNGVQVHQRAPMPKLRAGLEAEAWSWQGARRCELWTSRQLERETVPRQCQVVGHEIGHDVFGLDHGPGIMQAVWAPIPGACFPATTKAPPRARP